MVTSPQLASGAVQSSLVKIMVFVEVVQAKSKRTPFAKIAESFSGDTTIPTILEKILQSFMNLKWTKTHTHNLEATDLDITWARAMTLEDGTGSLTLSAFYNHYHRRSWTTTHRSSAWKDHLAVKQNQKFVQLEIIINESLFKKRTEAENVKFGTTTRTKRKRSNTVVRETLQSLGRGATIVNYALPPSTSEPQSLQYVRFDKFVCKLSEAIFDAATVRYFKGPNKLNGQVCTTAFAKGAIMVAHELLIDGKKYAARQVFAIDRSGRAPTCIKNKSEIVLEHIHLQILDWGLDQFLTVARENGIKVATNITVTESFILETDWEVDGETFFVVEPFRTPSTRKFSNSLTHFTQGNSKLELTLAALAHFIFAKSNRTVVYADIQGSPSPINGQDGYTLFDPVFHSEEEEYGVADLGREGIESFINTHICNEFCIQFSQVSMSMGNSMVFFPENPGFEAPRKKVRLSRGAASGSSAEPQGTPKPQSHHDHEANRPEDFKDQADDSDEDRGRDDKLREPASTEQEGGDDEVRTEDFD